MRVHFSAASGPSSTTEATLFRQAQAGCRDSLNLLMARHEGLVQALARRQVLGTLPFSEALPLGRVGLWRAILRYDPGRGVAFSTYAWPSIQRQIWQAAQAQTQDKSLDVGCQSVVLRTMVDPVAQQEDCAVQQTLAQLVERLPERLRHVVVTRYGLDGHPRATFAEIGASLGVTQQRACQLHTEALVWLRQPAHSQTLRSLLDHHTAADYQWADDLAQRWLQRRGGRHGR